MSATEQAYTRFANYLILAALRALNNKGLPEPGQPGAEVEDFDVSPELQRQFMNTLQAFDCLEPQNR